jgi:antitoxin component YwqK of YwqJK toxin-antitoxin module
MRTLSVLISILVISTHSFAQQKVLYLDSCENFVNDSSYSIKRVVVNHPERKFNYIFKDYYRNGALLTTGVAKSRNGKTRDDNFTFFHSNQMKLSTGSLYKDLKQDAWIYFDNSAVHDGWGFLQR